MSVTIYHNPACGLSRNVFALLGILPQLQRGPFAKENGAAVVDAHGNPIKGRKS